jgi:hypothetical protein
VRKLRTKSDLMASGWSRARVQRELRHGSIRGIVRGVFGEGSDTPSELDVARATALVTGGVADAVMSAQLHGFDGVERWWPRVLVLDGTSGKRTGVRRMKELPSETVIVGQVRCLPPPDTLLALAAILDDIHWEQALEFCLRRRLVTHEQLQAWRVPRARRVIKLRGGLEVPPTESLLETLAVQLIRRDPSIPTPTRQFVIYDEHGNFVGRPDLCWPELGIFLELDGQQHDFQPVYDANRQTRIAIKTGWLPGRFTWDQVNYHSQATLRDIAALLTKVSEPLHSGVV